MKVFKDLNEMGENVGQELGVTEWQTITQEQINDFAEVTGDLQWIHTKPLKAKFGPFGTTIAHGFLVLSLAPKMLEDTYVVKSAKMGVNYGLDRVRFMSPTFSGGYVRALISLVDAEINAESVKYKMSITFEQKGQEKPVCVAEFLAVGYE